MYSSLDSRGQASVCVCLNIPGYASCCFDLAGGLTEEEIRTFKEQQQAKGSKSVGKVPAQNVSRPRSAPYPCPPLSPWRNAYGANGTHHLANLDVGSYGSKLSDSDSEPE